jgi:hypothetical protein
MWNHKHKDRSSNKKNYQGWIFRNCSFNCGLVWFVCIKVSMMWFSELIYLIWMVAWWGLWWPSLRCSHALMSSSSSSVFRLDKSIFLPMKLQSCSSIQLFHILLQQQQPLYNNLRRLSLSDFIVVKSRGKYFGY